jgi:AcrR family transcriptional regulator
VTECNRQGATLVPVPRDAATNDADRLSGDARREALLDVTRRLVDEQGPGAVTMGAVAERAGVTRALVYKHFENKDALLVALYQREATALDRQIRRHVDAAAEGFEPKLRAFVGACLEAVGEHSRFFTPLRSVGAGASTRRQQRRWDRRTSTYFVGLAVEEFGIDEGDATAALGVLFLGLQSLLSEMRRSPGAAQREHLEAIYVEMTLGALSRLGSSDQVRSRPVSSPRAR